MAGGVTLSVRQIGSYPLVGAAGAGDLILTQPGGLGNPYATITAQALVATALSEEGGPIGIGIAPPVGAVGDQIVANDWITPSGGSILWNCYFAPGGLTNWLGGLTATFGWDQRGWVWEQGAEGVAGSVTALANAMVLNQAGALSLPLGTLTVARDPGAALEVATMGWVGRSTVTSFNGRQGAITLNGCDVYSALCLTDTIATETWVNAQIQASIQMLLANHPFVFGWNGRTGAVYLTLADISCVFFQPGQQPITQTPPLTSNDYSIPNTAWVVEYIANEFAGGGGNLATQSWVLANTVNSFNGRKGVVTLTSADVYDVGAAPLNSPAFSGIPTAPTAAVGQATGQIATTAFVQQAISANTAGVSTFNTRSGDVTLEAADVIAVGGLTNPSANLTGNPTAPTQPPGTNLPVIATCEFVQAALAAGAVTSFNTRTGAVTLTLADVTGVGGAPLVSPAFSSVPTAPTAAPGTNTVQLATTAFVTAAVTAAGGVSSFNSRTGAVDLIANDISAAGGLVNPSVGLTGSPTATTATAGDNSTRIATTAFVQTALSAGAVSSFNTRTGAVTLQGADITGAGGALLASPAFTGVPTAPTATAGTNNTQIATTAYVTAAILADTTGVTSFNTRTGAISLLLADITGAGGAPLASPSFTGTPLGPTATAGTSTTQLATTAFVQAAIASSGVSSFNARTGAVTLIANDISAAGGALLASPTFTGVPAAPTAAPGNNTTQLATTAFVTAAISAQGGPFLPLRGGTMTGNQFFTPSTGPATGPFCQSPWAYEIVLSPTGGNPNPSPDIAFNTYLTALQARSYITSGSAAITYFDVVNGALNTVLYATGTAGATVGASINSVSVVGNNTQFGAQGISFVAATAGLGNGVSVPIGFGLDNVGNATVAGVSYGTGGGNRGWLINSFQVPGTWQGQFSIVGNAVNSVQNMWGDNNVSCTWATTSSDPRLKHNVAAPAVDALGVVNSIAVSQCDFSPAHMPDYSEHWDFTIMATDVEAKIPFAYIPPPDENGYATLAPLHLIATLWRAVQQLSAEVEALKGAAA